VRFLTSLPALLATLLAFGYPQPIRTQQQSADRSNQTGFPSVQAFLKQNLTGESSLSVEAKGDLNNDGREDWAGVILREQGDFNRTNQLYVLLRQPDGGFRVAEKSREEQIAGMGCCWVEDVKIDRSSIYIQNNAKTAVTMEAATHQFKFYKNQWRLVGVKIVYTNQSTDAASETAINFLTGAVIEKKWKGEDKPTIKRRKKKFGRFLLKDFDFFNGFGVQ
jgi:hypothetical protein